MKIHLRKRKQSKNGKINLFLDIYKGYTKTKDGKNKSIRDYEYLDLYLYEKDKGANFYMAKYIDKEIDYDIFGL